jgi:hypothetical protein
VPARTATVRCVEFKSRQKVCCCRSALARSSFLLTCPRSRLIGRAESKLLRPRQVPPLQPPAAFIPQLLSISPLYQSALNRISQAPGPGTYTYFTVVGVQLRPQPHCRSSRRSRAAKQTKCLNCAEFSGARSFKERFVGLRKASLPFLMPCLALDPSPLSFHCARQKSIVDRSR